MCLVGLGARLERISVCFDFVISLASRLSIKFKSILRFYMKFIKFYFIFNLLRLQFMQQT
jgi:hypothetical protein